MVKINLNPENLLPCPLCGANVNLEESVLEVTVRCQCGLNFSRKQDPAIRNATKNSVTNWWNRRRLDIGGFIISLEPEHK